MRAIPSIAKLLCSLLTHYVMSYVICISSFVHPYCHCLLASYGHTRKLKARVNIGHIAGNWTSNADIPGEMHSLSLPLCVAQQAYLLFDTNYSLSHFNASVVRLYQPGEWKKYSGVLKFQDACLWRCMYNVAVCGRGEVPILFHVREGSSLVALWESLWSMLTLV